MIAAFDPSITHLGWVLFDPDSGHAVHGGVFKTSPADGLLVQRIIAQREKVRFFLNHYKIDFISMEAPYWGDFSTEILFALNQHLHEIFLDLKLFVLYLQPLVIKKMALPNMSCDEITKHHMTHQAKKELDKEGKRFSEHVADAYFVGKIGLRFYNWYIKGKLRDEDLTPEEYKLFCEKHTFVRGLKKGMTEYKGIIYRKNDQYFDYRKNERDSHKIAEEVITQSAEEILHGSSIKSSISGRIF